MSLFLIGLAIFFALHLLPIFSAKRQALVETIGQVAYTSAFGLLSLTGLVLIVYGYGVLQSDGSANPVFWTPPIWMKHIVFLLMLPSFVFLAAAYIPSRIRDALQHPMLVAIKIWAFSHLLANGDLASIVLFSSFLAYAVIDRISVKKRSAAGMSVRGPLGERSGGLGGDIAVIAIGVTAYIFMLTLGHGWLIGIALIHG